MKTNFFYHLLVVLGLCGLVFCGENAGSGNATKTADSTQTIDSMNAAHHVDPSTAYPQPPVMGSNVDSSRSKDSIKK